MPASYTELPYLNINTSARYAYSQRYVCLHLQKYLKLTNQHFIDSLYIQFQSFTNIHFEQHILHHVLTLQSTYKCYDTINK